MTPGTSTSFVRVAMSASAFCLAVLGVMLLIVPETVSAVLMPHAVASQLAQLLGGALLGFAAMNWIARGSVLGGIYGRAVVAGNQTHLTIGALVLLKRGIEAGATHPSYWVLTGMYVLGAGFFGYLTFFSSGLPKR
jgi:hypothetical protein